MQRTELLPPRTNLLLSTTSRLPSSPPHPSQCPTPKTKNHHREQTRYGVPRGQGSPPSKIRNSSRRNSNSKLTGPSHFRNNIDEQRTASLMTAAPSQETQCHTIQNSRRLHQGWSTSARANNWKLSLPPLSTSDDSTQTLALDCPEAISSATSLATSLRTWEIEQKMHPQQAWTPHWSWLLFTSANPVLHSSISTGMFLSTSHMRDSLSSFRHCCLSTKTSYSDLRLARECVMKAYTSLGILLLKELD